MKIKDILCFEPYSLTFIFITLFLGFHTLFVYVYNDYILSFGEFDKFLALDSIFGEIVLDACLDSSFLIQPLCTYSRVH